MNQLLERARGAAVEAERLAHTCRRWRMIAIVSAACVVTAFFGLIGALLCHGAAASADQGHIDDARAKLRWGQMLTLTGLSLAMLIGVAYLAAH